LAVVDIIEALVTTDDNNDDIVVVAVVVIVVSVDAVVLARIVLLRVVSNVVLDNELVVVETFDMLNYSKRTRSKIEVKSNHPIKLK